MFYVAVFMLLLPAGLIAQVSVSPDEFVTIPGGSASFSCVQPPFANDPIVSVQWLLNDTLLDDLDHDNAHVNVLGEMLRFFNITPDYNGTKIRCMATLNSGDNTTSNGYSLLLVQGYLLAVGSLNITTLDSTLSLTWTAPFTLDISFVDPDITGYCVGVVNSTSLSTLHSECNITETEFSYPIPPDADCHIYTFTVTPVNIVGMGEPAIVAYKSVDMRPKILDSLRISDIDGMAAFTFIMVQYGISVATPAPLHSMLSP